MTTPLGGPSQIIVKCRHARGNDSAGRQIRAGDAVVLQGTSYDTDQGEPILLIDHLANAASDHNKFLGVALSSAATGAPGATTGSNAGGYCHVCVFGMVQARCSRAEDGAGLAHVSPGEAIGAGGSASQWGTLSSNFGTHGNRGILVNAGGASMNTVGIALGTGLHGAVVEGSTGTQAGLTWVFINGIGRHGFGGS